MQSIRIRQSDGALRQYKNAEFIPAFLMIPEKLLNRTNQEMITLKRTPRALFSDPDTIARVESDNFLQVVIDVYAYLAWPYMGIHGKMEDYSGYDPFWRVAHCAPIWVEAMEELQILPKVGDFYRQTMQNPDQHFGFVPEAEIIAIMETAVPYAMEKHGFHEMYQYVRKHRCHEDFGSRRSFDKTNFYVRWYHSDTKHPTKISTDVLRIKNYTKPDFCVNADGELEESVWDRVEAKAFWDTLSETDRKILWLRWNDMKMEDVAKASVSPRTAPFQNEYRASEDGMRSSPGNCWDFRFQSKEDKNYIDNKHNNGIIIKNTFERAYENTNPTFERFAHKRS